MSQSMLCDMATHGFMAHYTVLYCPAVIIANERRSESVQAGFVELFTPSFIMRKVPLSKMDAVHQHPAIELYLLKRKKGASLANLLALEAAEADDLALAISGMQQLAASAPAPGVMADAETEPSAAASPPSSQHGAEASEDNTVTGGTPAAFSSRDVDSCAGSRMASASGTSSSSSSSLQLPLPSDQPDKTLQPSPPAAAVAAAQQTGYGCSPSLRENTVDNTQHSGNDVCGSTHGKHGERLLQVDAAICGKQDTGQQQQQQQQAPDNSMSWQDRRQGSVVARLLADIHVPAA